MVETTGNLPEVLGGHILLVPLEDVLAGIRLDVWVHTDVLAMRQYALLLMVASLVSFAERRRDHHAGGQTGLAEGNLHAFSPLVLKGHLVSVFEVHQVPFLLGHIHS